MSYYWNVDHLGSIAQMTNSSGVIQASYLYDSFGRKTAITETVAADFQYADYYFHPRSGLSLTLRRAYNTGLGRWINRDPIGESGDINLFAYVNNSSINLTDPSGTQPATIAPPSRPSIPDSPSGAAAGASAGAAGSSTAIIGGGVVIVFFLGFRFYLTVKNPLPDLSNLEVMPTDHTNETRCKGSCEDQIRRISERFADEYRKANIFYKNKFDKQLQDAEERCKARCCKPPKPPKPA